MLREFAERGSEPALAELVARHVNKVYSAALRHTRNPHSAEEITQAVFVILAQKAKKLQAHTVLSGWLYQTARLTSVTLLRGDIRRIRREQEALMQITTTEAGPEDWSHIAPLLDEAMAELRETDRHAVVLRYFDGKSLKAVGLALGISEDAAKMRVNRAVEKLRTFFLNRGVVLTTAAIVGAVSAHSVQAAPATLAASISAAALAKGAAAGNSTLALVKGTFKFMAWTNAKPAVAIAAGALLLFGGAAAIDHKMTAEPAYGGKTVTDWLDSLPVYGTEKNSGQGPQVVLYPPDVITNNPAFRALMKIGPRAVPILAQRISDRADWPREIGPFKQTQLWLGWNWSRLRGTAPPHRPAPQSFPWWQVQRKAAAGFMLLAMGTNGNAGFIRYAETIAQAPKHESIFGTEVPGAPVGTIPGFIIKSAVASLPDQRKEIVAELLSCLQHTNSYCREVAVECLMLLPDNLPLWKDRLVELTQDEDAELQEAALGCMMGIAQSKEQRKILPAIEIRRSAEAVLANPKTTDRVRDLAEMVRSLSMRDD